MSDLPRAELLAHADKAIRAAGGPELASVHFKFTCSSCGERCILAEVNTLRERGECWLCGAETEIREGGYLLQMKLRL